MLCGLWMLHLLIFLPQHILNVLYELQNGLLAKLQICGYLYNGSLFWLKRTSVQQLKSLNKRWKMNKAIEKPLKAADSSVNPPWQFWTKKSKCWSFLRSVFVIGSNTSEILPGTNEKEDSQQRKLPFSWADSKRTILFSRFWKEYWNKITTLFSMCIQEQLCFCVFKFQIYYKS